MKSFEQVFDYYMKLYSNPPEKYTIFGNFGEGVWDQIVTEGLITSYPKEHVLKFLNLFSDQLFDIEIVPYSSGLDTIDIYITSNTNQLVYGVDAKSILDPMLKVYGYFVGKVGEMDHLGRTKLLIEAKFPVKLSKQDLLDIPFFHITSNIYLDKIMKIGLTPRESTTIFTHPGNRIYLIQTNDSKILYDLRDALSIAKREKTKQHNTWRSSRLVALEIDPIGLELYVDPMFDPSQNYNAVFTQQNIHPDRIRVTKL